MKSADLFWMAIKSLRIRLMALPALTMAICAFCLCYAGTILATVQEEKSLPYELKVISNTSQIQDTTLAEISGIPYVTAVTPVLGVPVSVEIGAYKAQLTLTGIDAAYINEAFAQGDTFTDSSVMPYIVLNKAACKQFEDENIGGWSDAETEEPQIDWLNAVVTVRTSETAKPVVSKIAGLLSGDDEEQEPAAYISIASAKALLQQDGLGADCFEADVRVASVGYAESVSKAVTDLGLSVSNSNAELQNKWDMEIMEMTYLILIGVICLISALVFYAYQITTFQHGRKEVFDAWQWVGMKEKKMSWLFIIQTLLIGISGVLIGIVVSAFVPSFISPEVQNTTIFSLKMTFSTGAICFAICVLAWIVPSYVWLNRVRQSKMLV